MKNLEEVQLFYDGVRERLGNDLVISLAYDSGEYYLAISVHKSETWQYEHGRNIQSCLLSKEDMNKDIDVLVSDVVELYRMHMVEVSLENEDS